MTSRSDNPKRPVGRYQDFLDAALGTDMTQEIENSHAARVLEAIDCSDQGNYIEAADLFWMASSTALTDEGKQCCQVLAIGANDAFSAYENALANAASETKAQEIAKAAWNILSKKLSVYLNFLGVYFSERKKYLEAIQYYDRAIKVNPSYAMAYFSRGGTKADLRFYSEAIQDLKIAEQLFHEQDDLINYQNARKVLIQIRNLNSGSNQEVVLNDTEPRSVTMEQAINIAEAQIYSLNNPYLSAEEKLEVAKWYILPTNLMIYAFLATAIYSTIQPLNWFYLLGIPLAVNLFSGLVIWFFYSKNFIDFLYRTVLNDLTTFVFKVAGVVFLISKSAYLLAVIVALSLFGLVAPFGLLHLISYAYLSKKYKMNPQYAFFKRFYNFSFPFEEGR